MQNGFESISENSDTSFDHYAIYDKDSEPEDEYGKGGFMKISINTVVAGRYEIVQKIGWGHGGVVYLCKDKSSNTYKAMKIVKSHSYYRQEFKDEVRILEKISSNSDDRYAVKLLEHFKIEGKNEDHTCAIYELLGVSLYEILKCYSFKGLPIQLCRFIAKEILKALSYFHNDVGIIVGDLRLKNILLPLTGAQNSSLNEKGIIDQKLDCAVFKHTETPHSVLNKALGCNFQIENAVKPKGAKGKKGKKTGSSRDVLKKLNRIGLINEEFLIKFTNLSSASEISTYCIRDVPTLHYKSPEIILSTGYTPAMDIWSFGCILFELVTGYCLFEPLKGKYFRKEDDLLAQMTEIFGEIPEEIIRKSSVAEKYFNENAKIKNVSMLRFWPIKDMLIERYGIVPEEAGPLADFLKFVMNYDFNKRPSAVQALEHPWFKMKGREESRVSKEKFRELENMLKMREFAYWETSLRGDEYVFVSNYK